MYYLCKVKQFKQLIPLLLIALFTTILISNLLSINVKVDSTKSFAHKSNSVHENCFFVSDNAPFSDSGCLQIHDSTGFSQVIVRSFKIKFLYRIISHTQLYLNKFDKANLYFSENIARNKLEGFYILNLRKLLI